MNGRPRSRVFAFLAPALVVVACLLAPRTAKAELIGIHADGYLGYSNFSDSKGGGLLGADGLVRFGLLEGGVIIQGSSNSRANVGSYAGALGIAIYPSLAPIGIDALAVAGVHAYSGIGADTYGNGASANVAFVQIRAGLNFLMWKPFSFGAWAYYGGDLTSSDQTVGNVQGAPTLLKVGDEKEFGLALRAGVDFSL